MTQLALEMKTGYMKTGYIVNVVIIMGTFYYLLLTGDFKNTYHCSAGVSTVLRDSTSHLDEIIFSLLNEKNYIYIFKLG